MQSAKEQCVETAPDISGAKAQFFTVQSELMTEPVGCSANETQFDVVTDVEREVGEGA